MCSILVFKTDRQTDEHKIYSRKSGYSNSLCHSIFTRLWHVKLLILYYCLFILCVFLLNLRYFLCYHVMVNKVVYKSLLLSLYSLLLLLLLLTVAFAPSRHRLRLASVTLTLTAEVAAWCRIFPSELAAYQDSQVSVQQCVAPHHI